MVDWTGNWFAVLDAARQHAGHSVELACDRIGIRSQTWDTWRRGRHTPRRTVRRVVEAYVAEAGGAR